METYLGSVQQAGLAGLVTALAAGFLFSFNPVSFASIPITIAYVTKARAFGEALYMGSAFVLGMVITHVTLGVGAALGGEWITGIMGRQWGLVLGPVLIFLGIIWTGWVNFTIPWFSVRGHKAVTFWGAFLMGIPFTIGVCPACSPGLWVTLTASAGIGSPYYGAGLLLFFAIGRSVPIIAGATSMGWLESMRKLSNYQRPMETVGGLILIVLGIYLLNETLLWFPL
jgi:cytochrome c-type biogenesis protein